MLLYCHSLECSVLPSASYISCLGYSSTFTSTFMSNQIIKRLPVLFVFHRHITSCLSFYQAFVDVVSLSGIVDFQFVFQVSFVNTVNSAMSSANLRLVTFRFATNIYIRQYICLLKCFFCRGYIALGK